MEKNRVSDASDKITTLIEQVNFLPLDLELPALSAKTTDIGIWPDHGKRYSSFSKPFEQWTESAGYELCQLIDELPLRLLQNNESGIMKVSDGGKKENKTKVKAQVRVFRAYLWGKRGGPPAVSLTYFTDKGSKMRQEFSRVRTALDRLERFIQLREQFRWTIYWAQRHSSWNMQFPLTTKRDLPRQRVESDKAVGGKRDLREDFVLPFLGQVRFTIGALGNLIPRVDEFSDAILSDEIDVRRIRSCQYCQRVFWAKRVDAYCCSKNCNVRRNLSLMEQISVDEQRAKWCSEKRAYRTARAKMWKVQIRY